MSRKVLLVTGAAGAIGSRLLEQVQEAGWDTVCLVHRRVPVQAMRTVVGSVTDPPTMRAATRGVDTVLHMAALTHSRNDQDYFLVNRDGTRNLVDAARVNGVSRFVFVSTRAISPTGGGYSESKHDAESIVRSYSPGYVIVRLPEVFGAGSGEGVDKIIGQVKRGGTIPLVGDGSDKLAPIHVDEAVAAIVAALTEQAARDKTYTLAGSAISMARFIELCGEVFEKDPRTLKVPIPLVRMACRLSQKVELPVYPDQLQRLKSAKSAYTPEAESDLGFSRVPLADALRRML